MPFSCTSQCPRTHQIPSCCPPSWRAPPGRDSWVLDCCVVDQFLIAPGILGNGEPHILVLFGWEVAVPRDGDDLPQLDDVHLIVDDAASQHVEHRFTLMGLRSFPSPPQLANFKTG